MGLGQSKQLHRLAGRPVLARTIAIFEPVSQVSEIVVAIDPDDTGRFRSEVAAAGAFSKLGEVVSGGENRASSVNNALAALGSGADTVLVHDGARPCSPPGSCSAAWRSSPATPATASSSACRSPTR